MNRFVITDPRTSRVPPSPELGCTRRRTPVNYGTSMIFTIGHSNHLLEKFISLLKSNKIEVLVDIRSNPFSRFSPHFNKRGLEDAVKASGIKYIFLGKELGGRPQASEFYDQGGGVLYDRLAESPLFLEGIDRVMEGLKKYRMALMCGEEDPAKCHRRLLVGREFARRGVRIQHIRGDGTVQDEDGPV